MLGENTKSKTLAILFTCAIFGLTVYLMVNISAIGAVLSSILSVCSPIIFGALFAYMLNPLLKLFEFKIFKKIRNPKLLRTLSLILTYAVAIIIIVAFGALIIPAIVTSLTELASKMDSYLFSTAQYVNGIIIKFTKNTEFSEYVSTESLTETVSKFFSFSESVFDTVMGYISKYGPVLVTFFKNVFLGLFISIYILVSKEKLTAQSRKLSVALFRKKSHRKLQKYFRIANRTFSNFLVGKSIDSLIIFFVCLIAFSIAKIPYAPLISVTIGITNFVPIFGLFLGAIPSLLLIFIANPSKLLVFIILILIIQIVDGNIITPKILGNSAGISSLGVITAIVVGSFFNIVGMIVAVPIFATLMAIITDVINSKLKKNSLPTDVAEYYESDSLVDPHEVHETFSHRIATSTVSTVKKIAKIFKAKAKKNDVESQESKNEENDPNE